MPRPDNGLYIILGEVNLLVTAMRRNTRWAAHSHQEDDQDPLINNFSQLKDILNAVADLDNLAPNEFLSPFLEVIRSEDTTGPITGLALTSINKFLSYGLIEATCETTAPAIENIADAVTHARFVGTDPGSDEVVLMKILHVLRTLLLTPAGAQLANESVCEIMQSCFRICFEMRLSELLRKSAEHTLMDMVQLLFSRLPQFKEDAKWASSMRKLKMRAGVIDPSRNKKRRSPKVKQKRSSAGSMTSAGSSSNIAAAQNTATVYQSSAIEAQSGGAESSQQGPMESASASAEDTAASPEAPTNSLAETVIPIEDDVSETPADAVTDPSASDVISPIEEEVLEDSGVIATTPMLHGTTVIDIHESFQHASEAEGQEEESCSSMVIEDAGPAQDAEPSQYDGDSMAADTPASTTATLSVPGQNQLEATEEFDKSCGLSDVGEDGDTTAALSAAEQSDGASIHESEYINPRGVRFMPHQYNKDGTGPIVPYGLPCVQELFRFLISLTNPLDRHNTDVMIHMGLSLLTVGLESGADHLPAFNSLTQLVKDDMCRNLFFLLQSERLSLFAASIRVCFLLFEALRTHLKFQLEMYLTKLMDIIVSESPRISYEQREIALESVVQIMRIPGLVTEMYLNYDCDLYCSNLFEDLMKLLSKNAFPVSGLFTTHLLSLDALLAVIDSIEQHCHHRVLHSTKSNSNSDENTTPSEMDPPPRPPTETRIGVMSDTDTVSPSVVAVDITVPPPPPASGFTTAHRMMSGANTTDTVVDVNGKDKKRGPQIRPNRMKTSASIPTEEELVAIKNKKKIYQSGTEQFNVKPSKGIAFLQDQELLATPLDAGEVATFLKENPKLDKKMIGEYISNKKYSQVLEAYQKSFIFDGTRLDQALRMYLETFRLPGESPVIAYLMEHFAEHWHKMNNEPFANADAAFTLGYAIIMLNVDQHNHNAKKQNIPMTVDEFKRNVKNVNGGQDFDQDMLCEIYEAIKNEEIVMPAEHTGLVKENYLWKVLLSRGTTMEGLFLHAPTGSYDRDLFALVWGPTVAALSFVFDKSLDKTIIQKAISGFRKCAMISAHYGMSDVFDNLVISLCKFTTLLSAPESAEMIPIMFGNNMKAQLAAQTVFNLAHRHGDILREGWKNILDCMLQLHRAKMLPEFLVRVEDFVDPTGRISLIREETAVTQRADTGVLSSFYSYFTLTETAQQRGPSPEDQEASRQAQRCIQDCHVEQLITDTKFLRSDALHELLKALIFASRYPEMQETMNGVACEEDASVFFLELLIRVVLQNRDRVAPFWQSIRDHLYSLIVNASEHTFLVERAVVGLLRLAIRLLRRDEVAPQVLASLGMTLLMKPIVIHAVSRQVSYGLHDLLKTNAANIHLAQHWYTLFTLLEVVGAGMDPPPLMQAAFGINIPESISDAGAQSDSEVTSGIGSDGCASERGYTSDSEIYTDSTSKQSLSETCSEVDVKSIPSHGSWLLVNPEDLESDKRLAPVNQYTIALNEELKHHDQRSLIKSCETLAFLVRDAAHITPHNFESCVHAIRTFVEASLNGGQHAKQKPTKPTHGSREKKSRGNRKKEEERRMKKSRSSPSHLSQQDSDEERETDSYHSLSIQLLDLMHTLHTRAATIFSSWAEAEQDTNEEYQQQIEDDSRTDPEVREPYMVETIDAGTSTLWVKCWCPLLQGIARLCCDSRRHVRSQALTYLQRALLVHDLQTLSAMEWESCFNKVLFPLLSRLLEPINQSDPSGVEETQMRASTLLCRVFLQHLTPLKSLSTFTALWLTILEFMDKYMHVDKSDLLCEAIPESLKNMLLVMHTAGILQASDELQQSQLWKLTWDRIGAFLPSLKQEVFKPHELEPQTHSMNRDAGPSSTPLSMATTRASSSPPPQQPASPPSSSPHLTSTPSPTESPVHTSPITNKENLVEGSPPPRPVPPRPKSPLASTEGIPAAGTYILHPPLPHVSSPKTSPRSTDLPPGAVPLATVPILLNPDIIKGTNYPIISPQNTPEHQRDASPEGH